MRLDPMRSFAGDERSTVSLGLPVAAGRLLGPQRGGRRPGRGRRHDRRSARCRRWATSSTSSTRMGDNPSQPDPAARASPAGWRTTAARRPASSPSARGSPLSLDADFIVFWAPNLALPDRETLASEHRSRMMLPEQVLGQALLYLVAAVGPARGLPRSAPVRRRALRRGLGAARLAARPEPADRGRARRPQAQRGDLAGEPAPQRLRHQRAGGPAGVALRVPPGPAGDPRRPAVPRRRRQRRRRPPPSSTGSATGSASTATCASGSG